MNPNEEFHKKRQPLVEVEDNGKIYYKIRCSVCNHERYVAAVTWNAHESIAQCNTCIKPSFKRV
jgi:hypothetical protein